MKNTTTTTVPVTMPDRIRLRVTAPASYGDKSVLVGGGIGAFADAIVDPGLHAWSPPS